MREARIHVPDEALAAFGIGEFVSVVREAGVERITELQCGRPGCLLVVEVADPVSADRLSLVTDLEWWERVDAGERPTYLCKLAVPAFEGDLDPHHETPVSEEEVAATDEGVEMRLVGDHADLADRVEDYGETGASVLLRALSDYDGPTDPLDALTDRQREVLATAFEAGYFEVPREATTDDVAAELGVDPSTVREHLQRAQHNLLAGLLAPDAAGGVEGRGRDS